MGNWSDFLPYLRRIATFLTTLASIGTAGKKLWEAVSWLKMFL
jgi:hypothetical protein